MILDQIKKQIPTWELRYNALDLRQRILINVAILALIFMIWEVSFGYHIKANYTKTMANYTHLVSALENQDDLKTSQIAVSSATDISQLVKQAEQLQVEVEKLNQEIARNFSTIKSANELMPILKSLLEDKKLRIERVQVLPEEFIDLTQYLPAVEREKLTAEDAAKAKSLISKLTIQMDVSGSFIAISEYIQLMESMEQRVFLDDIQYSAENYPTSVASLKFYVLVLNDGGHRV